jgi:hypothetical protein
MGLTVTTQKYDYSRWGRPAGMDDPSRPCGDFDDSRPVTKLTASLQVVNGTEKAMTDWGCFLFDAEGAPVYTCFQGYESLPEIPSGETLDITFSGFVEEGGEVAYGYVADENLGASPRLAFPKE